MKKVLLHICCGICALEAIEKLRKENFYVEGFFLNPNIHPEEEYLKRMKVTEDIAKIASINLTKGIYRSDFWFDLCDKYKNEPEGGKRCLLCYEMRLKEAFKICKLRKFDYFTTTLTISPHKKSRDIFDIGRKLGGESFLAIDFKKQDGFKKTIEKASRHSLYRQNYCGCIYSRK